MSLAAGTRLGPYEIVALIGAGGMGEVYRARDGRLRRDVAIKVLPAGFADDPGRLHRFEQEARAVAALSHPNVLAIFDIGHQPAPFLVTELLEGETLRALLERGAVPVRRLIELALQITSGLAAAHARDIVHRDLKPGNLFITRDGVVKLLDFGLAKTVDSIPDADADRTQTRTIEGTVLGTVGYMSPEQVRGGVIDHRTDLFACGAVLYEMATGKRAFQGETAAETMSAVLREEPPEPPAHSQTPPALLRLIRRCLEKTPDRRFQSAHDLRFAVESISGESASVPAHRPDQKSVAVIPFTNMSADPENEYFSDGLAEDLTNALARLPGLRVASRTSAFRFRGRDFDSRDIGRQLNVDTVLEGSVRRIGKRLRVTAQLVNAADGYHLWSERYDREMADVFDIQDEITTSIVKTLEPALLGTSPPAARRHTDNPQAYELYLKGRHFWYQRTERTLRAGMECFEGAIDFDARYALAHAGLADSHSMLRIYLFVSAAQGKPPAAAAAGAAMQLDATLSESQYAMALHTLAYEQDWTAAEAHYAKAVDLAPQSAMILPNYGVFLASCQRFDESAAAIRKAVELDPLSPFAHGIGALAHYIAGRHEESVRLAERALDLHPNFVVGLWPLGLSSCALNRHDRAIEALTTLVTLSRRAVIFTGMLGFAYARAGRRAEAQALLAELGGRRSTEYVSPFAQLLIQFGLEDRDSIYSSFDACLAEGDNGWHFRFVVGPFLGELASDPRSSEYLRRFPAESRSTFAI